MSPNLDSNTDSSVTTTVTAGTGSVSSDQEGGASSSGVTSYVPPEGSVARGEFDAMMGQTNPGDGSWVVESDTGDFRLKPLTSAEASRLLGKSITDKDNVFYQDRQTGNIINVRTMSPALSSEAITSVTRESVGLDTLLFSSGSTVSSKDGPDSLSFVNTSLYAGMSSENLMVLVRQRSSEQMNQMIGGAVNRLKGAEKDIEDLHTKNVAKIKEAIEKTEGIGGLIIKILFFILLLIIAVISVVAAVATANPMFIFGAVVAIMALVNSGLGIASEVVGEDITFGGLFSKFATQIENRLVQDGYDRAKAEAIGKIVSGSVGILTGAFLGDPRVLGLFFEGLGQSAGMSEESARIMGTVMAVIISIALLAATMGASSASQGAAMGSASMSSVAQIFTSSEKIIKIAKMGDDAVKLAQMGVSLAQAGHGIYQAKLQEERTILQSDIEVIRAFIDAAREEQKILAEDIKKWTQHEQKMQELTNQSLNTSLQISGGFRGMV